MWISLDSVSNYPQLKHQNTINFLIFQRHTIEIGNEMGEKSRRIKKKVYKIMWIKIVVLSEGSESYRDSDNTKKEERKRERETICKAHLSFFQSWRLIPFYKGSVKTESWYQHLNSSDVKLLICPFVNKVYIMLDRAASQDVAGQRDERRREQKRGRWLNIYRFKEPAFSFFLCRDCILAIWQNRGSTRGLWPIANALFSACSASRREWSFNL